MKRKLPRQWPKHQPLGGMETWVFGVLYFNALFFVGVLGSDYSYLYLKCMYFFSRVQQRLLVGSSLFGSSTGS